MTSHLSPSPASLRAGEGRGEGRSVPLLTQAGPHDDEPRQRPLDFGLIGRILRYTQPYAGQRNWLFLLVVIRSIQLPALIWIVAAVIRGPIARSDSTIRL